MIKHPLLTPAPDTLDGLVKAWEQPLSLPTYEPAPADRNPMFLEKRVFQGSSGRVYPLPFFDRIESEPVDHAWDAVYIENEYLRVIVLPELGGRIYAAIDKRNGYDCIYRNPVIKPALVGLAGPWISGGIEFNWPQHHRPSTYMPADWTIEEAEDGSVTVWLSEHEPMNRMKGMHGVRLYPGIARFDTVARLHNRTSLTQTVMWWANAATEVHEHYQSFFPADAVRVADHAKRDMSTYPHCDGHYYGVNYGERALAGVPASDQPSQFVPTNGYSPDDLRWYANIPVPTSYMCVDSEGSFFGGYDHSAKAGLVHVADRHKSPGKKQWTWGNHDFGYAWDRNLTDPNEDGIYPPYIELMAGVYTDNQPDFSFLAPGETKTFTQHWYPIGEIGPADGASADLAANLSLQDGVVTVALQAIAKLNNVAIELRSGGTTIDHRTADLSPNAPLFFEVPLDADIDRMSLELTVISTSNGATILEIGGETELLDEPTEPASEPPAPHDIDNNDELYITGLHLEQYRHATRTPEIYWREALKRDPFDSRCNNALGLWHLRRGELDEAESCFRTALKRLRKRNPNPYDGEAFYNLGITLRHQGQIDQAYRMFGKAAWNVAWIAPSLLAMAEIDMTRSHWSAALDHTREALTYGSDNLRARAIEGFALRALGRDGEADALFNQTLSLDPLDYLARDAKGLSLSVDPQVLLDLALDYGRMGMNQRAFDLLSDADIPALSGVDPLRHYYAAWFADKLGQSAAAASHRKRAAQADSAYCFPCRLEEIAILKAAIAADDKDPWAPYYLGNLLYDKRRYQEAIALWERSGELEPEFPTVWRNLGIGYHNIEGNVEKAMAAYNRAYANSHADARIFYERDQLWKRVGVAPDERFAELASRMDLVKQRDDLSIEFVALLNQQGQADKALEILQERNFQPWEGGEGLALEQYMRARIKAGKTAMASGNAQAALDAFKAALSPPQNLGEACHLLANQSDIHYWIGLAADACGDEIQAQRHWQLAADFKGDFLSMEVRAFSEKTYYSILSMIKRGQIDEGQSTTEALSAYAQRLLSSDAKIDYFATSLPTMLIFEDDIQKRQDIAAQIMLAQCSMVVEDWNAAKNWLNKALEIDPNNALANDLLSELDDKTFMYGRHEITGTKAS